jgi:exodeoxyribonuclease VII large subunit
LLQHKLGNPSDYILDSQKEITHFVMRLEQGMSRLLERRNSKLQRLMSVMDSLSPLRVVERGYSIVTKENEVIKSYRQVQIGERVQIQLAEGKIVASVESLQGE